MGRIIDMYEGRKILSRLSYTMAGTITIGASQTGVQFPAAAFLHTNDRPFEVHRMLPVVLDVDVVDPTQVVSVADMRYVSGRVFDFGTNQELLKASTPLAALIKSPTERVWEWTAPHTLKKTHGFTVTIDTSAFDDTVTTLRVQIAFQGYLLTLPPERS